MAQGLPRGMLEIKCDLEMLKRLTFELKDLELIESGLKSLRLFLLKGDGGWLLDSVTVKFISSVITSSSAESRVCLFRLLAACSVREDFINLVSHDRHERVLMHYAHSDFIGASLREQSAFTLFLCNAASHQQGQMWLLFFSEWKIESKCSKNDESSTHEEPYYSGSTRSHQANNIESSQHDQLANHSSFDDQSANCDKATVSNAEIVLQVVKVSLASLDPDHCRYGLVLARNLACGQLSTLRSKGDHLNTHWQDGFVRNHSHFAGVVLDKLMLLNEHQLRENGQIHQEASEKCLEVLKICAGQDDD